MKNLLFYFAIIVAIFTFYACEQDNCIECRYQQFTETNDPNYTDFITQNFTYTECEASAESIEGETRARTEDDGFWYEVVILIECN